MISWRWCLECVGRVLPLYLNFRRITETLIVMLLVPFVLVGGI